MAKRSTPSAIVHLLIGRLLVRVQSGEQVRGSLRQSRFTISSPSAPGEGQDHDQTAADAGTERPEVPTTGRDDGLGGVPRSRRRMGRIGGHTGTARAWIRRRRAHNRAVNDYWAAVHPPSQLDVWDGADIAGHLTAARIEAADDLMTVWDPDALERLAAMIREEDRRGL